MGRHSLTQAMFGGTDDAVIGFSGTGGQSLRQQFVANYAAKTPYLGLLGLSRSPTTISLPDGYSRSFSSTLGTLANQKNLQRACTGRIQLGHGIKVPRDTQLH